MKPIFKDRQFFFEFIRSIGLTPYGMADIGECLAAAGRIRDGNFKSWFVEWKKTADRIYAIGENCLKDGKTVSARESFLRASNYYRTAEFFMHEETDRRQALECYRLSREAFLKACPLFAPAIERIEIPYENGRSLKGYFMSAGAETAKPVLIINGGYDSTAEEQYATAAAAVRRGYHALFFDGPGQGYALREDGLYFRPDWENVITPVVDHMVGRGDVDGERIALIGFSLGGYFAPRAAAFEPRIKACIADGGVYDFFDGAVHDERMKANVLKREQAADWPLLNWIMRKLVMPRNTTIRWAIMDGIWKLNVASPFHLVREYLKYNLDGISGRITCPVLICDSEDEMFFHGQSRILFDRLTCPKELLLFGGEEGAGEHCQAGAMLLAHQRIFDWLDNQMNPVNE